MAKRIQEKKEEEIIVAKSRPTDMNLSETVPASSSSAKDLDASRGSAKLIASGKSESRRGETCRNSGESGITGIL